MTLYAGAGAISTDLSSGAFVAYLSTPISRVDYLLGKAIPVLGAILVVTLDTTRRDHLGFYGYERGTSPNLDRLAEGSVVYTRAYSTSSWTLPARGVTSRAFSRPHGPRVSLPSSLYKSVLV